MKNVQEVKAGLARLYAQRIGGAPEPPPRNTQLKVLYTGTASVVKPEPELVKSRNRNFSKVGTGTVKLVTVPQHWVPLPEMSGIKIDVNKTEENFQKSWIKPM
jgi:hypothetical protein